ncbi:protein kinase [Micromonospora sp. NPDC050417]|uniref:protein kinase domain-containing protein n=1 Tax=Micromonospora sp. NPDC050417 TaxID=3364280 RepID=UPI00378C9099
MSVPELLGGRYQLGELLGIGGMAEVYRGRDLRLGRDVAIKMLRAGLTTDATFQMRFRREAQNSASLNHPAIVAVYDTGERISVTGEAWPFIAMEFVDGRTLKEVLAVERRLMPRRAMEVCADICTALEFSHRQGIIHRDIKPSNVMLSRHGQVKVADFGIARAYLPGRTTMTRTSAVIGSVHYLSPEQVRGDTADYRSDVYAAGCLMFALLCGHPPFVGESKTDVMDQHVRDDPPLPSHLNPDVEQSVDAIVLKALAKDPLDRYQSAAELRADLLRAIAGRPVTAALPEVTEQPSINVRGPRWYETFASKLGDTSTFTVWRSFVVDRWERQAFGLSSAQQTTMGWTPPRTEDLVIRVYPSAAGGAGNRALLRGSAGEVEVPLRLPSDLAANLARASSAIDTARLDPTLSTAADLAAVRKLGTVLFDALLHGESRSLYRACHHATRYGGDRRPVNAVLRLVLRMPSPELAALPWELMFDDETGAHVALEHPIVRYVEMPVPVRGGATKPPLYVLGMVVSPDDLDPVAVAAEREAIEEALRQFVRDGLVRLSWVNGQTWQDLQRKLYKRQYHALHFVGHGGFDATRGEGYVAFANSEGKADRVFASDLGAILANQNGLRMVVLNTCESARDDGMHGYTSTAEALVRRGVNSVLSMRDVVSDPVARKFATVFYEALAASAPIDVAAMMARLAVRRDGLGSLEWGTPTVFMRSGSTPLFEK